MRTHHWRGGGCSDQARRLSPLASWRGQAKNGGDTNSDSNNERSSVTTSSSSSPPPSPRSLFTTVEVVQPLTSVSNEKRRSALEALAGMDTASSILLDDTFFGRSITDDLSGVGLASLPTPSPPPLSASADDEVNAQNRKGSVPGATSMGMLRRRAAESRGYALSPRESTNLYLEDGGSTAKRWAVGSLIEKLDAKIKEQSDENYGGGWMGETKNDKNSNNDDDDIINNGGGEDESAAGSGDAPTTTTPEKRKRGRPRKYPLSGEKREASTLTVPKSESVCGTENSQDEERVNRTTVVKSVAQVTGGSLTINNKVEEAIPLSSNNRVKLSSKLTLKGSVSLYAEPYIGVNAIVDKQRRERRRNSKSLYKSSLSQIEGRQKQGQDDGEGKRMYDNPGRGMANDALNLNRYYKTELLTAREEYFLGMKVRFMVKCQAVHEGLALQLDRNPTIAEWAAACGFDVYDAEICAADYVEGDLDRQIRPSGSDDEEIDPNMFVGNGLVTESGVGRGKGRVKKPPPTYLRKFYDDSYEKFKGKKSDGELIEDGDDDEDIEGETDIFLYRQRLAPGEPINRGSPRIFREMMLTAKEAKQRMVQCNMRLVVSIARRYHRVNVNVQDLVQEGSLGLARAAEKFDPKMGFKFSTYASWWIQQAVFRSIAYHSRTIRLPVHVHNLLNKVRRARQVLQQELGRMPSNEEMADEMDMSVEKYNKMIRNTRNAISLERPKYLNNPKDLGHESEALVGDMVDSSAVIFDEKTPEQSVDHGLLHNDIQYMLGKLGEDERGVLCLRYGINDGITRTVTLVASEMRQTKSWVRSQECRALRKLRRPWYERRLKEHRESLTASHGLPI